MTPQPLQAEEAAWFGSTFDQMVATVERAVLGKTHVVRLTFTCLLAGGHLLLEDFPGTGKTSLARALANAVDGSHNRIQFTPDLLPSDVTGVSIYDQTTRSFDFHRGPIFASIVLADEINRASPKTQSALLEVMEEGTVTYDGTAYPVGRPFMVIATQNPIEQAGTYRLPEAQLDRFLMKTSLGYPDHATTVRLLADAATRDRAGIITRPVVAATVVDQMSDMAARVHLDPSILEYVSRIAERSRELSTVQVGVSVRGCLALVRCSRAWAAAQGRAHVLPDDVKDLAVPVLAHRLSLDPESELTGTTSEDVIRDVMLELDPPRVRVG